MIAYDSRLWKCVSLRPEMSGLHVSSLEALLALIRFAHDEYLFWIVFKLFYFWPKISIRFGPSLRYIELPIELITHTVLYELGSKCPNLTHMLLDFSTAMQLHDFNELQVRALLPLATHSNSHTSLYVGREIPLVVGRWQLKVELCVCVLSFMKLSHKSSFVAHCESAGWLLKGVTTYRPEF
jgi:hypothetical protein